MLEISLRDMLEADMQVNARISFRVYHIDLPQNPIYPAVTFIRTGTNRLMALDGPAGLATASFSIDCWAANSSDAILLANDVMTAIEGWSGVTIDGDTIHRAVVLSDNDDIENITTDELTRMRVRSIQVEITYKNE